MTSNEEIIEKNKFASNRELMDLAREDERKSNYERLVKEKCTYADGFDMGYEQGCADTKEKTKEIISKWRVQLEDIGFITISKKYVDELLKELEGKK